MNIFATHKRVPPFAIVSLSRSGSTALHRTLRTGKVRIEYEPEAWHLGTDMAGYCRDLFSRVSGIKHVWDPNGWPFTGSHKSTMETLANSDEWIDANASLFHCARKVAGSATLCVQKVVLLRRRNQLARIVSDLIGQQTDLWGHNPGFPHSEREVAEYRQQLSLRKLAPFDLRVIEWYLGNAFDWEDRITSGISAERKLTVYYEDLFGPQVDLDTRLTRVSEVADWLEIPISVKDERVRAVLRPGSKVNDASTYERIPNYREIVARFGEI